MKLLVVPFGSLETYVIIVQRTVDGYRGSHVSHTVPCPRESRGDERERTSDANRTSRRLTVDGPSMGQVKERTERGSTKARDEQTRSRTRQLRVHAYRELLFGNVRARVPSTSRRSIVSQGGTHLVEGKVVHGDRLPRTKWSFLELSTPPTAVHPRRFPPVRHFTHRLSFQPHATNRF